MRKIIVVLFFVVFLFGCEKNNVEDVDYSKYLFTNVSWTRDSGHDIEHIKFNVDGSFSYYCDCGNPVNDSDLCESYTYNDETKEIKFECFETTDEMVTNVKIVNLTDTTIELDFDGEIRIFEKESY